MNKLRVLDLFSGIGGFSLGLERTGGFETVAFCEIEEFPRKVLAKHWPKVPIYDDVRTLTKDVLDRDGIAVDVICGGFPCQDISVAGKGLGLEGKRSGLWREIARLVSEIRPQLVIVENVSALLNRGMDAVLADLAEVGFDAEWHCIPASSIGAPHRRDRVWIVAYPCEIRCNARRAEQSLQGFGLDGETPMAYANEAGFSRRFTSGLQSAFTLLACDGWWHVEPAVGRVANGIPNRVDRIAALGNAVVPQIPELIGNAILQSMRAA